MLDLAIKKSQLSLLKDECVHELTVEDMTVVCVKSTLCWITIWTKNEPIGFSIGKLKHGSRVWFIARLYFVID